MDKLFDPIKVLFKAESSRIDNYVFRLHYKFTVICIAAFCLLVSSGQHFGDPINCMPEDEKMKRIMKSFCWVHSTFSVEESWNKEVGVEVPYPGVDKFKNGRTKVYHLYYQWVGFVLLLQALVFYVPRYFWKCMEGGRIKQLVLQLNSPVLCADIKVLNRTLLVEYLYAYLTHHNWLFVCYVLAEMMNLLNVVGQMFLMDRFLGGHFTQYGLNVISFAEWDWSLRYDPMIRVFPRLTKCEFYKFGPSATVEKYDLTCILPVNIINEKIYVFLWFWFVVLLVLSGLVLLYRALVIALPRFRMMMLKFRAPLVNPDDLQIVMDRCKIGDWMVINRLSKNLDSINFRDLIADFASKLRSQPKEIV